MSSYTYVIVGRRRILETKTVHSTFDSCERSGYVHHFSFRPDFDYAPQSMIVVYHIKDRKIVSDYLSIDFSPSGDFKNFVELDVVPGTAKPGQIVDVNIKSNPNAFIGLLGIDKSVNILKSGNDLTRAEIWRQLKESLQVKRRNFVGLGIRNRPMQFDSNDWKHFSVNVADYEY